MIAQMATFSSMIFAIFGNFKDKKHLRTNDCHKWPLLVLWFLNHKTEQEPER